MQDAGDETGGLDFGEAQFWIAMNGVPPLTQLWLHGLSTLLNFGQGNRVGGSHYLLLQ
jgi:hypothetical protein